MTVDGIRVLVADDQALVRGGFRAILAGDPRITVVAEAADGAEAVAAATATRPDVALVDVRMPVMDGIEATRRIVGSVGSCRVVMLTTFDLDDHVYDAFRAGATGFLLKTVSPESLVASVRAAYDGDCLLAPALTRRLVAKFVATPAPREGDRLSVLTEREREVLRLVAAGLSNAEIAGTLFVSHGTVKTHVGRILAKLGLRDRVQAVVLAYECGLVRAGDSGLPGPR